MIFSVDFIDKVLKIDDPVGASSVHGVCGAWGTLAAGIFNAEDLFNIKIIGVQALGALTCFLIAFIGGGILFKIINKKADDVHSIIMPYQIIERDSVKKIK